jgi:hypothetical protein
VARIEDSANEVDSKRANRAGGHENATWRGEANEHRERGRQADISKVRSRRGVTDVCEATPRLRKSIAADYDLPASLDRDPKLEPSVSVGDAWRRQQHDGGIRHQELVTVRHHPHVDPRGRKFFDQNPSPDEGRPD